MNQLKKYLIFLFILPVLVLVSCWPLGQKYEFVKLSDLSEMSINTLSIDLKEREFVYKVSLYIKGKSDGDFEINNWNFNSGDLDTVITGIDWYEATYQVDFKPITSKNGTLEIGVDFFYNR